MPAAAVIPAPIVDIKIVAVEKLVVEILESAVLLVLYESASRSVGFPSCGFRCAVVYSIVQCHSVTESKLECSKQAIQL